MLNLRDLVTWPGYSSPVDPWPWSRDLDTPHLWIPGPGHVAWILLTCGSLALVTWPGYSSPVDPWPWSRVLATWPGYFSRQCSRQALLNGKIKKVLWIIPVPVAHVNNQRQVQRTANRISKATATRYKACTARYGLIYRNY